MLLNLSLAALIPLLTTLSLAQNDEPKAEARQAYDRGVAEYNLGRFDRAIVEFERAYKLDPAPMLLYNLAQAERRAGNLRRAVFLYERFVSQAPAAQNAANARRHIQELNAAIRAEEAQPPSPVVEPLPLPAPPPSETAAPTAPPTASVPQVAQRSPPVAVPTAPLAAPRPRLGITAELGLSRLDFGREDLQEAFVVPVGVGGQYHFAGPTSLVAGLSLVGARFVHADRAGLRRAQHLFGVLASLGVGWPVGGMFSVGPELAAGLLWWSGLQAGNRFTVDGAAATGGPVPLPTVRLAVPVAFGLSRSTVVAIRPSLTIAWPGSGLRASIDRLISAGVAAGVGVRF